MSRRPKYGYEKAQRAKSKSAKKAERLEAKARKTADRKAETAENKNENNQA